jgi:hypothetical protein
MFNRPADVCAFFTILAVCTAGAMRLPWWAALVGACCLILLSLYSAWGGRVHSRAAVRAVSDPVQFTASTLNGAAIAAAAFGIGHVTALVWGV